MSSKNKSISMISKQSTNTPNAPASYQPNKNCSTLSMEFKYLILTNLTSAALKRHSFSFTSIKSSFTPSKLTKTLNVPKDTSILNLSTCHIPCSNKNPPSWSWIIKVYCTTLAIRANWNILNMTILFSARLFLK